MDLTNFKLKTTNSYDQGADAQVAANSLDVGQGTLLSLSGGFAVASGAGATIVGTSKDQKTFASDNQTVAMKKVSFRPVKEADEYLATIAGGTSVVFDAALVASNTINMTVNGVAMTQVTYASSNDATLDAIATQLATQFPTLISAAARSGTRAVAITVKPGVTITITSIIVAAGSSQANGVQTNNVAQTKVGRFYDITATQLVDGMTDSASTGQVQLVEYISQTSGIFKIVNL